MTQQKPTERNHYVPQFLQRNFTDENGRLWVYDKAGGDPSRQHARDTGVEKFLYTIRKDGGQHDDSLEKAFRAQEGEAKRVLDRLIQPGALIDKAAKPFLAEFMAFMHTSVPRSLQLVDEIGSTLWQEHLSEIVADEERFNRSYSKRWETRTPTCHLSR